MANYVDVCPGGAQFVPTPTHNLLKYGTIHLFMHHGCIRNSWKSKCTSNYVVWYIL